MKILVINPGFLPNPAVKGGAVENLMDIYLESKLTKKIKFIVYSRYDKKVDLLTKKNNNVEYRYIKHKFFIKEQFDRFASIISDYEIGNNYIQQILKDISDKEELNSYDYVLVENTYQYVIPLRKFFGNIIILHQHNCMNEKKLKICKKAIINSLYIFTVSDFVKRKIENIYNNNNTYVLFNGIKLENFKFQYNESLIEKFKIKKDDFVICYVGRVVKEKGILELLEAFQLFSKDKSNVKLIIIGSECFSSNSDKFVMKCKKIIENLKEKVIFTGFINYNEINKYYSLADVQIVPSIVDDSCPMAVIEGMSVGLAQIVTNSGGIPEEVSKGNAITISRENLSDNIYKSLNTLYSDEKLLKKMKLESLNRSKYFSEEKYVLKFIEYLENIKENKLWKK